MTGLLHVLAFITVVISATSLSLAHHLIERRRT